MSFYLRGFHSYLNSHVDMLMIYSVVFSIVVVKFIEVHCLYDVLLLLHNHYNYISVMFRVSQINYISKTPKGTRIQSQYLFFNGKIYSLCQNNSISKNNS